MADLVPVLRNQSPMAEHEARRAPGGEQPVRLAYADEYYSARAYFIPEGGTQAPTVFAPLQCYRAYCEARNAFLTARSALEQAMVDAHRVTAGES